MLNKQTQFLSTKGIQLRHTSQCNVIATIASDIGDIIYLDAMLHIIVLLQRSRYDIGDVIYM